MRFSLTAASVIVILGLVSIGAVGQETKSTGTLPAKSTAAVADRYAWRPLFDGKTLTGWKATDFFRPGKVHLEPEFHGKETAIVVDAGSSLSGVNWAGDPVPKLNYEIALETMKVKGSDFMCGLTFPVADSYASLIMGGWGGYTTGISSLDLMDASENETRLSLEYVPDKWYRVRVRVTETKIQAWLDDKQIIDVVTKGRKVHLRFGDIGKSIPIGVANYQTESAYRAIKLRLLTDKEVAETLAQSTKR